jgi:type VI secretion system protein VasD
MSSPLRLIWLRRAAKALAVLLGVLLIGRPLALAQPTPPAGSTPVELTVVGGTELNPNAQGRASPVVVRIFELAGTAAFEAGDFATLTEHPDAALKHDLIAQDEFVLRPGEIQPHNGELGSQVRALGVVAGFRDLEHAVWRLTVPLKSGTRNFLLIDVDKDTIRLVSVEPGPS